MQSSSTPAHDGESDDDDTPPSATPARTAEPRRGTARSGGSFGLLPVAFLDRLLECATLGGSESVSSPPPAGAASSSAGRWSTMRQCRIPAMFKAGGATAMGGAGGVPVAAAVPPGPGGPTGSKRVMSAMQVWPCRAWVCGRMLTHYRCCFTS